MKRLYSMFAAMSAALLMWSCGPAEISYTEEWTYQGLYTVNKATVQPEFGDTMIFVRNMDEFELETGDRAFMVLHYYYDAYSGKAPVWNITQVIKKVSVRPLSVPVDVDTAAYMTPVTGLQAMNFYDDFEAKTWIWKGKQNINVKYRGVEDDASFVMTVRGVKDGYVEFDLFVNAKESDKEVATLLTFDITNVADFLSDEEKASLPEDIDNINAKIYLKRMNNGRLEDWAVPGNDIKDY